MTFIPNTIPTIDATNCTTTLLLGNETFTGNSKNTNGYSVIRITVTSDVGSAPNGIIVQMSDNEINWTNYNIDVYISPSLYVKSFRIYKKYYRIIYNNGTSNQSIFSLQSFLLPSDDSSDPVIFNDKLMDDFGKLKNVTPYTLLDIKLASMGISNTNLLLVSKSSGSITTTQSNGSILIETNGISSYKSQSRIYATYQAGKTIEINISGVLNNSSNTNGCNTYLGYYDDENGLFFGYNALSGISVNLRNNRTTTSIESQYWNLDAMNGTGKSGINLDYTKGQLFVIQFAWLGVGVVKFGFIVAGELIYCHVIKNYNALTFAYMSNPNLPIRYEISCQNSSDCGSMIQTCGSVISWGGFQPIGRLFSISNGSSTVTLTRNETPIIALSGNSNYKHQNILPMTLSSMTTSNGNIMIQIRLYLAGINENELSVSTGGSGIIWTDVDSSFSLIKYSLGNNITNGGIFTTDNSVILMTDFVYAKSGTGFDLSKIFNMLNQLTSNVSNISDIICVTGTSLSNSTALVTSSITWQEIY